MQGLVQLLVNFISALVLFQVLVNHRNFVRFKSIPLLGRDGRGVGKATPWTRGVVQIHKSLDPGRSLWFGRGEMKALVLL